MITEAFALRRGGNQPYQVDASVVAFVVFGQRASRCQRQSLRSVAVILKQEPASRAIPKSLPAQTTLIPNPHLSRESGQVQQNCFGSFGTTA